MRNFVKLLACVLALAGLGMSGCNKTTSTTSTATKTDVNVQFVPSIDAGRLATLTNNLKPILEKYEPNYNFNLTSGDSYAAVTEAMLSDQMDIGFLTASGYAEATLKHPGKVEVLLTSVRKGYKVQCDDYPGTDATALEKQKNAMNDENGYTYLGEQSNTDVNWYTSELCVKADKYVDKNGDGKIDIKDMAGLKIVRQGTTSGAGYLRPLKYLHDHGMSMVDTLDTDATKAATEIQGVYIKGYDAAFAAMMDGSADGFWGYTDVRYSVGYNKEGGAYYHKPEAFTASKVVALTDPIYNDTISARANLAQTTKDAVMNAFISCAKDGTITTEGTGAYYLYQIYSHTGYTKAKDSDFDGERSFYQYCVDAGLLG
jgi:phosphonate transport system substrate-binding protein